MHIGAGVLNRANMLYAKARFSHDSAAQLIVVIKQKTHLH